MSEKRLSKRDGARLVSNSGRGFQKGDAILDNFNIDYKEYTTSFAVNRNNWEKHAGDAWEQGQREPLISLVLDGNLRLAIVDWDTFMHYKRCYDYIQENKINMRKS